jgi:PTS system nitrogen regulatory IIA component
LNFESMDGQPVFLFFLLVAPEGSASIHLKVLARIAKMLKDAGFRKSLMQASTREELYKTITRNDEEF